MAITNRWQNVSSNVGNPTGSLQTATQGFNLLGSSAGKILDDYHRKERAAVADKQKEQVRQDLLTQGGIQNEIANKELGIMIGQEKNKQVSQNILNQAVINPQATIEQYNNAVIGQQKYEEGLSKLDIGSDEWLNYKGTDNAIPLNDYSNVNMATVKGYADKAVLKQKGIDTQNAQNILFAAVNADDDFDSNDLKKFMTDNKELLKNVNYAKDLAAILPSPKKTAEKKMQIFMGEGHKTYPLDVNNPNSAKFILDNNLVPELTYNKSIGGGKSGTGGSSGGKSFLFSGKSDQTWDGALANMLKISKDVDSQGSLFVNSERTDANQAISGTIENKFKSRDISIKEGEKWIKEAMAKATLDVDGGKAAFSQEAYDNYIDTKIKAYDEDIKKGKAERDKLFGKNAPVIGNQKDGGPMVLNIDSLEDTRLLEDTTPIKYFTDPEYTEPIGGLRGLEDLRVPLLLQGGQEDSTTTKSFPVRYKIVKRQY